VPAAIAFSRSLLVRGDDAYVGLDGLGPADPLELALL